MYTLNRDSTKRAVELLKHTVGTEDSGQMPLLSYLVLRFGVNRVTFEATNLTTGAILDAFADTTNAPVFECCVPFKVFSDLVGKLRGDHIVLSPVYADGNVLTGVNVVCGKYTGILPALDADDFPQLPKTYGDNPTVLPSEWLASLSKRVGFAVATDVATPVLQGVYIHGDGTKITAAATDRYRVVETSRELEQAIQPTKFVLPARTIKLFAEASKQEWFMATAEMGVNDHGSMLIIKSGDMIITSRIIDGTYPNYQRGYPDSPLHPNTDPGWTFTLKVEALRSAVDLVSLTTDVDNRLVVSLADQGILGTTCTLGAGVANHRGKGEISLDITVNNKEPVTKKAIVAVHAPFLSSVLAAVPNEHVEVMLFNKDTALMLVAPDWRAFIQPMPLS